MSDYAELVKRLLELASREPGMDTADALETAATAISTLQGERDALAKALEPFAKAAEDIEDSDKDHWEMWEHHASMSVTVADFRNAHKALKP